MPDERHSHHDDAPTPSDDDARTTTRCPTRS